MYPSFVTAYSPCSTVTVGSINRKVLACRTLPAEIKLGPHDWPQLVPILHSVLREAQKFRLEKRIDGIYLSPLELMTEIECHRRLLHIDGFLDGKSELSLLTIFEQINVPKSRTPGNTV